MENLLKLASDYGALGLMLFASFWYILRKDKEHKEERKELREVIAKQHEESLEVTRNTTTVLTEISVLIRNRR